MPRYGDSEAGMQRVDFNASDVVGWCGLGRRGKPDGRWMRMLLQQDHGRTMHGVVVALLSAARTDKPLGLRLYSVEPIGDLFVVKLDEPVESWVGGPGDFAFALVRPNDVLRGIWKRVKNALRR